MYNMRFFQFNTIIITLSSNDKILGFISVVHGFALNKVTIEGQVANMLAFIVPMVILLVIAVAISRQPQSSEELGFSVGWLRILHDLLIRLAF